MGSDKAGFKSSAFTIIPSLVIEWITCQAGRDCRDQQAPKTPAVGEAAVPGSEFMAGKRMPGLPLTLPTEDTVRRRLAVNHHRTSKLLAP